VPLIRVLSEVKVLTWLVRVVWSWLAPLFTSAFAQFAAQTAAVFLLLESGRGRQPPSQLSSAPVQIACLQQVVVAVVVVVVVRMHTW
jgi:hypothetical protein